MLWCKLISVALLHLEYGDSQLFQNIIKPSYHKTMSSPKTVNTHNTLRVFGNKVLRRRFEARTVT